MLPRIDRRDTPAARHQFSRKIGLRGKFNLTFLLQRPRAATDRIKLKFGKLILLSVLRNYFTTASFFVYFWHSCIYHICLLDVDWLPIRVPGWCKHSICKPTATCIKLYMFNPQLTSFVSLADISPSTIHLADSCDVNTWLIKCNMSIYVVLLVSFTWFLGCLSVNI